MLGRKRRRRPRRPGSPTLISIKENMSEYLCKLGMPTISSGNIVKRELHVNENGMEQVHELYDVYAMEYDITVQEGSHIIAFLVDFNGAGVRSADGATLEFNVFDVAPPMAPDAPTLISIERIDNPI